ncbi:MAG: hypothetical protein Q7S44_00925 [bacterium]|nr:hypothetical protein [bacterium]
MVAEVCIDTRNLATAADRRQAREEASQTGKSHLELARRWANLGVVGNTAAHLFYLRGLSFMNQAKILSTAYRGEAKRDDRVAVDLLRLDRWGGHLFYERTKRGIEIVMMLEMLVKRDSFKESCLNF